MSQFLRPNSDIESVDWTPTPLWQSLDEVTADDTTTEITSTTFADGAFGVVDLEVALSNPGITPDPNSPHTFRARLEVFRLSGSAGFGTATIKLKEGSVIRSTLSGQSLTASYLTFSKTLAQAEVDSITSYANLSLLVSVSLNSESAGTTIGAKATWAEFQVPDAATVSGSGSQVAEKLSGSGSGTNVAPPISGSGNEVSQALTGSASGTNILLVSGSGAQVAEKITGSGSGTNVAPISGSGSGVAEKISGSAVAENLGISPTTGSGSVTASSISGSGQGSLGVPITGSGSGIFENVSLVVTMKQVISGNVEVGNWKGSTGKQSGAWTEKTTQGGSYSSAGVQSGQWS